MAASPPGHKERIDISTSWTEKIIVSSSDWQSQQEGYISENRFADADIRPGSMLWPVDDINLRTYPIALWSEHSNG